MFFPKKQDAKVSLYSFFIFGLVMLGACKTKKQLTYHESFSKLTTFSVYENSDEKGFPISEQIYDVSGILMQIESKIGVSDDIVILNPETDIKSWRQCLIKYKDANVFLLTPGNYLSWGPFEPTTSGTADSKKVLAYYDPDKKTVSQIDHPYQLKKIGKEVILERFRFTNVDHWLINGITFRGMANTKLGMTAGLPNAIVDSENNIINYCFIEDVNRGSAVNILNSSDNIVQNNLMIQNDPNLTGDNVGVLIHAHTGKESVRNKIVNNEIKNWNDGIAISRHISIKNPQFNLTGSCAGTIIENNDIYITPLLYQKEGEEEFAFAENAIDNKQGTKSTRPEDKILITKNRMWGYRATKKETGSTGSAGPALSLHRDASNTIIKNNIIFNSAIGANIFKTNPKFPDEKVENVLITDNIFYDIRNTSDFEYSGAAFYISRGVDITSNLICKTHIDLVYVNPKNENNFAENILIDVDNEGTVSNTTFDIRNANDSFSSDQIDQSNTSIIINFGFYIKRWTGPERVLFEDVIIKAYEQDVRI